MGLNRKAGAIKGSLRATYFAAERGAQVRAEQLVPTHDNPDDIYKANIQISELNALNACLAAILYKKALGFYIDEEPLYNMLFELGDLRIMRQCHED